MGVFFIIKCSEMALSAQNSQMPGQKIFIFRTHTGWWDIMHPEIGLKCCSGPIFFKTPPTLKNDEQHDKVMAKNVIFTKSPNCKQKFSKIQKFFFSDFSPHSGLHSMSWKH